MRKKEEIDDNVHARSGTGTTDEPSHSQVTGKHEEAEGRWREAHDQDCQTATSAKTSIYAGLGWLDRLLVVWILLTIIIGILLGNFVDGIGPALQRGKFVDVSVPIGMFIHFEISCYGTN